MKSINQVKQSFAGDKLPASDGPKATLIYLAGGNAARFGSNKLLHPIDGMPMYRHVLLRLVALLAENPAWASWEIVLVTQYREILDEVAGLPVKGIFSPESAAGLSYTIRAGILAADPDTEAYCFFVADQPYLTAPSIAGFFRSMTPETKIKCVSHEGERGNPVWFSRAYRDELLSLTGDMGGRRVLKRHPSDVTTYEVPSCELCDIDTVNASSMKVC